MRLTRPGGFAVRAAAALAVMAAAALAQTGAAAQALPWKEFRSAEGGFAILLPGQPSVETKNTTTDLGPIAMRMFTCTTDSLYCSVAFYDVPEGVRKSPDVMLEDMCNGFVQGAKLAEKAERRKISLGAHPGREIIGESADASFLLLARYYLVKNRVYLVMVGTAVDGASSPEVGRYLDSFRLVA
jgi:hypothetical protein